MLFFHVVFAVFDKAEKAGSKKRIGSCKAFGRNDAERYGEFIGKVQKGEAKLNASNVMPYELVEPYSIQAHKRP